MEKALKILVVSQYYWPEPFRITDICEWLVSRGHEVDVLTSVPNIPEGEFYEGYGWFRHGEKRHNGVGIERVDVIRRGRDKPVRLALNCASFAFNALFHLPHLRHRGYDVVFNFNNSPVSSIYPTRVYANREKIPYVVFVLDIWPDSMYFLLGMPVSAPQTLFRRISFAVSRWLYAGAQTLLVSSRGMEPRLRQMKLENTIEYFPNYAEPVPPRGEQPAPTRASLGLSETDTVIGFAGNIGKAQGLDKVVEAAAMRKGANRGVRFLIVGDGSELLNLKAQCAQAGVADRFVFTGWVDGGAVAGYTALCDVMLACLRDNEVLNLVLPAKVQTYMDAGKPVLAFMNGAGADAVREANCGFVARAEDAPSLCAAIEQIAHTGKAELARLGKNARRYCAAQFDRERILQSLERYLQQAVEAYGEKRRGGRA